MGVQSCLTNKVPADAIRLNLLLDHDSLGCLAVSQEGASLHRGLEHALRSDFSLLFEALRVEKLMVYRRELLRTDDFDRSLTHDRLLLVIEGFLPCFILCFLLT